MTDKPVVIFGTGAFAQVAAVYLARDSSREVLGYTVDGAYADGDSFSGLPLIPFEELQRTHSPDRVDLLVAIGFAGVNSVRREIFERCRDSGYDLIRYVSSNAFVMTDYPVGANTFVFEANVIQPFVNIGANVVLWSGNHIGHHSTIEDHCFVASHVVVSGNVTIGESCFVGVNATIRDGVTLGPRCVIGAGALVLSDLDEGTVLAAAATPVHRRKSWELRNF
jgi:sugar O-acyltransferase (sialic acid O-acetyltransferase NeuD family)